ncbi:MAG: hypothetical protein ISS16_11450 [Ignavibacteria bacterium]|nr:hypothetical protein [Ignavibacteria bacterium]
MNLITQVATIVTILSVVINIAQWWIRKREREERNRVLRSRSQALFNVYSEIEYQTSLIDKSTNLEEAKAYAKAIAGLAKGARQEVIAYSREHLNLLPVEDLRKGVVYQEPLPKPVRTVAHNKAN